MKVVHISTGVSNSSACVKLHRALLDAGIYSHILARDVDNDIPYTTKLGKGSYKERLVRKAEEVGLAVLKNDGNDPFNTGFLGKDLRENEFIQQADVIHLHWICGLLSMEQVKQLTELGKPVFWTCHDVWPVTGGCHIDEGRCDGYLDTCGACPYLKSKKLVGKIQQNKINYLKDAKLTYIAPSNWMAGVLKSAKTYGGQDIVVIPNALDTNIFRPREKQASDKFEILFGATSTKLSYKGFRFLEIMLQLIQIKTQDILEDIRINLVGGYDGKSDIISELNHKVWGTIDGPEKMADMYSQMDILIYPSLADNLPGVVAEALACEVPVLAFDIGGVSDLVKHKENGYLVERGSVEGLLKGLQWIKENNQDNCLGKAGRRHIMELMDPDTIVKKHIEIYERS